MRRLTALFFVALLAQYSKAQDAANDTTQYDQGIRAAITSYFQFINGGAGIYNGVEHPVYFYKIEGFAYYKVDRWQSATVEYNGVLYTNIQAKYDLVKDQVIVKHPTGLSLGLFSPRVAYFVLGGDRFIYMPGGGNSETLTPGFYQQLRTGAITALAQRRKIIEEKIEDQEIKRNIVAVNKYYLVKEGVYYSPRKEASLLALMGERRAEAKKELKKARIRFRKNPEQAILTVIDYYNK